MTHKRVVSISELVASSDKYGKIKLAAKFNPLRHASKTRHKR